MVAAVDTDVVLQRVDFVVSADCILCVNIVLHFRFAQCQLSAAPGSTLCVCWAMVLSQVFVIRQWEVVRRD